MRPGLGVEGINCGAKRRHGRGWVGAHLGQAVPQDHEVVVLQGGQTSQGRLHLDARGERGIGRHALEGGQFAIGQNSEEFDHGFLIHTLGRGTALVTHGVGRVSSPRR